MFTGEAFKDIPGHKNYYISSRGRVFHNKKELKTTLNDKGYVTIKIQKKTYKVHRLVCLIFRNMPLNSNVDVHHKDENKLHNYFENLVPETHKAHRQHHLRPAAKLNEAEVLTIATIIRDSQKTIKEIAEERGHNPDTLSKINNGKTWNSYLSALGFTFPIRED